MLFIDGEVLIESQATKANGHAVLMQTISGVKSLQRHAGDRPRRSESPERQSQRFNARAGCLISMGPEQTGTAVPCNCWGAGTGASPQREADQQSPP